MKKSILILFAGTFFLGSCTKEKDNDDNPTCNDCITSIDDSFLYVSNEGPFGGTGSISKINLSTNSIENSFYADANNDIPIGSVVQSLHVIEDRGYAILNGGNEVAAFNVNSFENNTIISINYPRYMTSLNNDGFITSGNYAGKVYRIDLITNMITDSVEVGYGPEQLLISGEQLIVTNSGGWGSDSTISIINLATFEVDTNIIIGSKPTDLVGDKNGMIWILASAQYDANNTPKLVQLDPSDWSVLKSIEIGTADESINKIALNSKGDGIIYYNATDVYALNISDNNSPSNALINEDGLYGVEVDPLSGDIFLFDKIDYTSTGFVHRYTSTGVFKTTYDVGVLPNGGVFK